MAYVNKHANKTLKIPFKLRIEWMKNVQFVGAYLVSNVKKLKICSKVQKVLFYSLLVYNQIYFTFPLVLFSCSSYYKCHKLFPCIFDYLHAQFHDTQQCRMHKRIAQFWELFCILTFKSTSHHHIRVEVYCLVFVCFCRYMETVRFENMSYFNISHKFSAYLPYLPTHRCWRFSFFV